ncbi:MAG: DUF4416 family protein [Planctomycetota bacterium]
MTRIQDHEPVKLFFSVLTGFPSLMADLRGRLEKKWGPIDVESPLFPHPHLVGEEMGADVARKLCTFRRLIDPATLPGIRIWAAAEEKRAAKSRKYDAKRPLDLDPGYVTPYQVVLSSARSLSHRIALGRGVYGEVTLRWRSTVFGAMEWTPNEYRTREVADFFVEARRALGEQIARNEPD